MQPKKKSSSKYQTWSLVLGVAVTCLSLWALHRFCDEYSELTRDQRVVPGSVEAGVVHAQPAASACSTRLGTATIVGAVGVGCLLGALLLQLLSDSPGLLMLSKVLAVSGRILALTCLGAVVLVLFLFSRY